MKSRINNVNILISRGWYYYTARRAVCRMFSVGEHIAGTRATVETRERERKVASADTFDLFSSFLVFLNCWFLYSCNLFDFYFHFFVFAWKIILNEYNFGTDWTGTASARDVRPHQGATSSAKPIWIFTGDATHFFFSSLTVRIRYFRWGLECYLHTTQSQYTTTSHSRDVVVVDDHHHPPPQKQEEERKKIFRLGFCWFFPVNLLLLPKIEEKETNERNPILNFLFFFYFEKSRGV